MNTKRGLSDVVTTVLIILVALGAIGIIVGFLLPMVKQGSSQITSACMTLSIEPVKCTNKTIIINATTGATANEINVLVKRNKGDTLKEVKVIFEKINGETDIQTMATPPDLLQTKMFTTRTTLALPIKVKLAGVVTTEAGDEMVCAETSSRKCE